MILREDDVTARAVIDAIRGGDTDTLRRLLRRDERLAKATILRRGRAGRPDYSYPLLGAATDWPGHFPDVAISVRLLVEAGADVNTHAAGPHREAGGR